MRTKKGIFNIDFFAMLYTLHAHEDLQKGLYCNNVLAKPYQNSV
jgi:hypothetical protein